MWSATFQPGSSANDFSITACNGSRSVALARLKRYCLGTVIAGKILRQDYIVWTVFNVVWKK